MPSESRTYTILGLLGEGGFGKVYRARLQGSSDFTKDVAIKVLHDLEPDQELLKRFRDEARILGLIRDRAIVSVDPPTRLGKRWAVVMDYADGVSCAHLLRAHERLPPGVAIEIIQEVARVLYKAYHFEGPDGRHLELLHRDIKPGNVQVSTQGEVRLLDFGVARASFTAREARTIDGIAGTPGYMAPERFSGTEGPEGDVYSLGVLLWTLVTGERPGKRPPIDLRQAAEEEFEGARSEVLALAARMRMPDLRDRPSAREVERACRSLRRTLPEPYLRDWAEDHVAATKAGSDELVGAVLSDTLFRQDDAVGLLDPPTQGSTRPIAMVLGALGASGVIAGVVAAVALVLIGVGLWVGYTSSVGPEPAPQPVDVATRPVPAPALQPQPVVPEPEEVVPVEDLGDEPPQEPVDVEEPAPTPDPEPEPAPVRPAPAPPRVVAPAPVAAPAPSPAPSEPEPPAPQPVGPTSPITVLSVPWAATVSLDGQVIGKTPLRGYAAPHGTHTIVLSLDGTTTQRQIRVGSRSPNTYTWKVEGDSWKATIR